ncbi:MAG: RdgB/HAM1 family non-canonical purine NTP pyrophosphatase [Anaerolineae bacterium]
MELLVGTQNSGKMREFEDLLAPLAVPVLFPPELDIAIDVKEKGGSYAENAELKARAYAAAARVRRPARRILTLADDSGLEVDGLDGAPGIRSARYAPGSDVDRLTTLLRHLEGVPPSRRTARFRCVIAIVTPAGMLHTARGTCEGIIAQAPAGAGGFGYDPVFYLPDYDRTMAQLSPEVKNRISHRARAAQAALPILRQLL